jgi:hypothetical protein
MSETRKFELSDFGAICGDPQVSDILGAHSDWVELWEKKGHLKSLGGRTKGCQRFYCTKYIFSLRENEEWLDKAIRLMRVHFKDKNGRRQS